MTTRLAKSTFQTEVLDKEVINEVKGQLGLPNYGYLEKSERIHNLEKGNHYA